MFQRRQLRRSRRNLQPKSRSPQNRLRRSITSKKAAIVDNQRAAEAALELDQAIKLDPDFAQALAYRGSAVPGPEGLKDLEQASAKAAAASKPEQLLIAALLSGRQADFGEESGSVEAADRSRA